MGVIRTHPTADAPRYSSPSPLTRDHASDDFDSGKPPLDDWLRAHALENEGKASRTYVVTFKGAASVVAFYTLAAGSVVRTEIPNKHRHGLPNPVPVMVLGRLAVDKRHHARGLGKALLREAVQRTLTVSREAGVRALIIHALDDEAVTFYAQFGFQQFPAGSRTMMLMIETMAAALP